MCMWFEIRRIDGLRLSEGWVWNNSVRLGAFKVPEGKDAKKTFLKKLKKIATLRKWRISAVDDWGAILIIDKKTQEPLYAALPM